jgi:hypothetical protein
MNVQLTADSEGKRNVLSKNGREMYLANDDGNNIKVDSKRKCAFVVGNVKRVYVKFEIEFDIYKFLQQTPFIKPLSSFRFRNYLLIYHA